MSEAADRLVAAYARFAGAIAAIPDPKAQELHRVAGEVPEFVAQARLLERAPAAAEIAQGLAQGLRGMPELIADVEEPGREAVSRALHEALTRECPDLLVQEAQRVAKPDARIVIVNHFQSTNRFIALVEKWLCPLCTKLGWRSDLALQDLIRATGVEIDYRYKLESIDLWETVVMTNNKSAVEERLTVAA